MKSLREIARTALQSQWRNKKALRAALAGSPEGSELGGATSTLRKVQYEYGEQRTEMLPRAVSFKTESLLMKCRETVPVADYSRAAGISGPDRGAQGGRVRSGPCAQAGMTACSGDARK